MKLVLLLFISCLALHNGQGAPRTAVYKFVRCNPEGDKANCVTQESPEMEWSPDLPGKLPASTAQYLEAVPVEDEYPLIEEKEMEETPMMSQEGESPGFYYHYEGSADEGSGSEMYIADRAAETETGSGMSSTEKGEDMSRLYKRFLVGDAKPAEEELKDDHLLQL